MNPQCQLDLRLTQEQSNSSIQLEAQLIDLHCAILVLPHHPNAPQASITFFLSKSQV